MMIRILQLECCFQIITERTDPPCRLSVVERAQMGPDEPVLPLGLP